MPPSLVSPVKEEIILDIEIEAPLSLDLNMYKALGVQPGEVLLPEERKSDVDMRVVGQLVEMGFEEKKCVRAVKSTGNQGSEIAMQWLFEHMDDPGMIF
jgi:ubiquitin carboxyl-terminal hydrolase 5/13